MAKGIKLNREQYKNVKRMDHKQMETFVVNMYNAGYEDGKKTAGSRVCLLYTSDAADEL